LSFQEVAINIVARDQATAEFEKVSASSRKMSTEIRSVGREFASFGASAFAIAKVGEQFGILDKRTADAIAGMGSFLALTGTLIRSVSYLADAQTIATIKTAIDTAVQWAHNASLAAKVVLLTMGVGAIVVAAAAMAALSMSTMAATSSMREFNATASGMPGSSRAISRAGEDESALLRRGVTDR
jgi:hypothetical protein